MSTGLVVAAGKVTASPHQLLDALDSHWRALHRKAPHARRYAMLLSETSPDKFNAPLVDWTDHHDWYLHHATAIPGADECAILSSEPFDHKAVHRLTDLHLTHATTGRTAPIELVSAAVRGGPWLNMWHTPAHNGGLNPHAWPTRVYLDALAGLRAARQQQRGRVCVIGADWNVALERPGIRAQLARPYPSMHWSWAPGQHATEGGRVIDGFLTNAAIIQPAETLPAVPGFDHRPVFAELAEHR